MKPPVNNQHEFRESWLRAATSESRPYFASAGYPLPDDIRYAIAFTSTGRKGKRVGECWHSSASGDARFEIFIRADLADPLEVLPVLVKELIHTTLPVDAGHGRLFKDAALKIGLIPPLRKAVPGQLLKDKLEQLATTLGALPHAKLDIGRDPLVAVGIAVDRPKTQKARLLKAWCAADECGYVLRVPLKWVRKPGPPHCPLHGEMSVEIPPDADDVAINQPELPFGRSAESV
jgi:hypothetical protein